MRCLRISALPNTLKLKPYGSSGLHRHCAGGAATGSYPSRPRPTLRLGLCPKRMDRIERSEAGSCQLCSHRGKPGGKRHGMVGGVGSCQLLPPPG